MQISPGKTVIFVNPGVYIGLCILLIIFPMGWVLSWIAAAFMHELSHYIALRLCDVRILSVRLNLTGAKIFTEPISAWKECVAAIAGPLGGVLLLFTARWFPQLAVCAFLQTSLNLIPIKEFDGGRVVNCILRLLVGNSLAGRISAVLEFVSLCTVFFIGLYISVNHKTGVLLPVVMAILILRRFAAKTPCKPGKQIVQCIRTNIRGTKHE